MVKLETTKDRRRLHIGSMFVDLNETDYRELIRIFANENAVKNLSLNLPVIGSFGRFMSAVEEFRSQFTQQELDEMFKDLPNDL